MALLTYCELGSFFSQEAFKEMIWFIVKTSYIIYISISNIPSRLYSEISHLC